MKQPLFLVLFGIGILSWYINILFFSIYVIFALRHVHPQLIDNTASTTVAAAPVAISYRVHYHQYVCLLRHRDDLRRDSLSHQTCCDQIEGVGKFLSDVDVPLIFVLVDDVRWCESKGRVIGSWTVSKTAAVSNISHLSNRKIISKPSWYGLY